MKKIHYGFAAILFMLGVACRKVPNVSCNSPTNDLALSRELIVGKWGFTRSQYFIDTIATFYATDNYSIDLKFKENGILEYYLNGDCIDTCRYEIDIMKKYTNYKGDTTRNVLWLVNRKQSMTLLETMVPVRVCDDSLYLKYESFAYHIGDKYFYRK